MVDEKYKAMLLAGAKKLNQRARTIKRVVHNIKYFGEFSDDERRLTLNNERLGLSVSVYNAAHGRLRVDEKAECLCVLGFRDDLAARVLNYATGCIVGFDLLQFSKIPEQFILRTMTEREYNGYMNGEIPIAVCGGVAHYLRKPESADSLKEKATTP